MGYTIKEMMHQRKNGIIAMDSWQGSLADYLDSEIGA
jgi:hypothetical protein